MFDIAMSIYSVDVAISRAYCWHMNNAAPLTNKQKAALVASDHHLFNALSGLVLVTDSNERSQLREEWAASRKLQVAGDVLLELGLIVLKKQVGRGDVDSEAVIAAGRVAPYITPLGRKIQFVAKWMRSDAAARELDQEGRAVYFLKRDRAFESVRIELAIAAQPNRVVGEIVAELVVAQRARQAAYFNAGKVESVIALIGL